MHYRSIIFDLGAVILDIDFQKTIDAFTKLGITDFDSIFSAALQSDLFDMLDKGTISIENFRKQLIAMSGKTITITEFDQAWNSMILDFPKKRIEYLLNLRKYYPVYLLSNTNIIHFPVYNKLLKINFGIDDIRNLFDQVYLSFQLGMRKPQPEIFQLVINENNLKPEETLFVDDNIDNIEAAKILGLGTLHLVFGMTIEKDLDKFLNS